MFGFINSFILPALTATALPLLIHLFNKRKTKTIPFSSIRFLKLMESKRIRQLRIYEYLLILLRTLFILCLILAFARPTLKSDWAGSNADITAVIVLDDSYSMQTYNQTRTYFQQSRELVDQILKSFSEHDNVFLLLPGQAATQAVPLNLKQLEFVDKLEAGFSTVNFNETLAEAKQLFLDHPNFNKELYFVSDFNINRHQLSDSLLAFCNEQNIHFFKVAPVREQPIQNVGIDTAFILQQIAEQSKPLTVSVQLHNYSESDSAETRVHLFDQNQRLAMQSVHLRPQQIKTVELKMVPKFAGNLALRLELDNDDLSLDNYYYLLNQVAGKAHILWVSAELPITVRSALKTLNEQSLNTIEIVSYTTFSHQELKPFDLLLLFDPPANVLSNSYKLTSFAALNRPLIVVPGRISSNETLNSLMQLLCGLQPVSPLKSIGNVGSYFSISRNWLRQSLFKALFTNAPTKIPTLEFYKYFPLQKNGTRLLNLRNGDALLNAYPLKNGRQNLYLFSSSFSLDWTNLPLQGVFVPFLQRFFAMALQRENHSENIIPGIRKKFMLNQHYGIGRFKLVSANSDSLPLSVQSNFNQTYTTLPQNLKPGQYRIENAGKIVDRFSVNHSGNEFAKPYIQFEQHVQNILELSNSATLADTISGSRQGRELWFPFALLAGVFLLLEMLLIKRIEGNNERTAA